MPLARGTGRNALARARLERIRRLVTVQEYRLRAALNALEEFEERVVTALEDFDDFYDTGSHDNGDGGGHSRRTARLRHVLDDIFEEMLDEDNDDDWVVTLNGLRVPRLDEVNKRLRKLHVQTVREDELEHLYIDFLNGD